MLHTCNDCGRRWDRVGVIEPCPYCVNKDLTYGLGKLAEEVDALTKEIDELQAKLDAQLSRLDKTPFTHDANTLLH